jgi:peptide/nickel transport system permease protein
MRQFIMKRLLLVIPTLFLVTIIVFSLVRLIPGDVVVLMLQEQQFAKDIEELRHKLGLDIPVHIQYAKWIANMFQGDFGVSLWTKRTAVEELRARIPVSMELGTIAMGMSMTISIVIGVIAALRQDTFLDYALRVFALAGLSIPGFWLGTLVVVLPSVYFRWSPPLEWVPFTKDPLRNLYQIMTPAIIMGIFGSASVMRMTRTMLLEVLRQDYIRTAWAKGLKESTVVYRHALKNALIPVVTLIGMQLPAIIGGTVIMEQIFSLPGMGRFMLEIINKRDYPMLQAVNLFFTTIVLACNLLVDISYGWLDPRVRYQ